MILLSAEKSLVSWPLVRRKACSRVANAAERGGVEIKGPMNFTPLAAVGPEPSGTLFFTTSAAWVLMPLYGHAEEAAY